MKERINAILLSLFIRSLKELDAFLWSIWNFKKNVQLEQCEMVIFKVDTLIKKKVDTISYFNSSRKEYQETTRTKDTNN